MPEHTQPRKAGAGRDQRRGTGAGAARPRGPAARARTALAPPAHNTADLLGRAWSRLGHEIVAGVNAAGYPQRPAHSAVFAHIGLDGTRLTELARRAAMTPQAMGDLVDDLERLGYVRRTPDPTDGRAKLIVPTETGYACLQAAFDTIAGIEARLAGLLGPGGLDDLRLVLARIIESDGAHAEPSD
jgi:DNA-binding MarR family transcriptional regulator